MYLKNTVFIAAIVFIIAGCKKEATPPKTPAKPKVNIYLVAKRVTTYLLTPSPASQTDSFTYNSAMQLVKHSVAYKSYTDNYTTNYFLKYTDGKVSEVIRRDGKYYKWDRSVYTYSGNIMKIIYVYPDKKDSLTITLDSKGQATRLQGNGLYYQFAYDDKGNIANLSEYANSNPTKAIFSRDYTYDKKLSPFTALRDNNYLIFQAFNDIDTYFNNRTFNNGEVYGLTYNKANYPTKVDCVHGPVIVRSIAYTYKVKQKDAED